MNTPCNETEKLAPLAVGGDLDAAPLAALREHVEGCRACADQMRAAEAARAAYRSALPQPEPVDLWPGLRERLAAEARPDAGTVRRPGLRLLPPILRTAAGLAAAAALVFLARPWFSAATETGAGPGTAAELTVASELSDAAAPVSAPANAAAPGASAFPLEALSGVSARPPGEVPGGTLAAGPAPNSAGGLTRIEGPTMGEELRQQALRQSQGGVFLLRGMPLGSEAQAASSRTWRRP